MKYFLLLFLFALSCKPATDSQEMETADWLLGEWIRIGSQDDYQTYEQWKRDGESYLGLGYTLKADDTIFKEYMRLVKNDQWSLEVSGVNEQTIVFTSLQVEKDAISIYNDQHDFPNQIHYWIQNDTLMALVGTDEDQIEFKFVKR